MIVTSSADSLAKDTVVDIASVATTVDLFLDGQWRRPETGDYDAAASPATGETLGHIAQGTRADANAAVRAAAEVRHRWAATSAFERAGYMRRVGQICRTRRDTLASALTLDQGKALFTEAYQEVDDLIGYWFDAAEDILRFDGTAPPSRLRGARALVERKPLGVVAVITPWNWPYTMPAQLLAPALAAGNTVVWVPAPTTSWCSGVLMQCLVDAELPDGVINLLTGAGPVVGDEIAGHPDVNCVAFVGSTATGMQVSRRAAGKAQIIEMGNNGPLVVMNDADLSRAVQGAIVGSFLCSGQSCAAAERIFVHRQIHSDFVAMLVEATQGQVRLGDPNAVESTMGPLNNHAVAEKLREHVIDALDRGATLCTGGKPQPQMPTDLYWPATILDNVPRDARVANEETFGPVAPIIPIDHLDDAINLTNSLPYGLIAAIYTADANVGLQYADSIRAAWVNINESTNHWESHLPFGGAAGTHSGVGRVGGRYALDALTQPRTVIIGGAR